MGLFSKKRLSLDEILEGIKTLSEEEKAQAIAAMQEKAPAPAEEVENVKEEPAESENVESKEVESAEESEAVEETETVEENASTEKVDQPETQTEEAETTLSETESATDEMANDNRDEIIHQLTDKVNEMSEQLKGLLELKSLMEEYTGKQAESFGYKGNVLGAKKDYKDMSTEELKAHVIKGI